MRKKIPAIIIYLVIMSSQQINAGEAYLGLGYGNFQLSNSPCESVINNPECDDTSDSARIFLGYELNDTNQLRVSLTFTDIPFSEAGAASSPVESEYTDLSWITKWHQSDNFQLFSKLGIAHWSESRGGVGFLLTGQEESGTTLVGGAELAFGEGQIQWILSLDALPNIGDGGVGLWTGLSLRIGF